MIAEKSNWKSESRRMNFECDVCLAWGFINLGNHYTITQLVTDFYLVFSHLPTRVLKLLMFVGLTTDRDVGIKLLRKVTDNHAAASKYVGASFLICFYSFYLIQFFGE